MRLLTILMVLALLGMPDLLRADSATERTALATGDWSTTNTWDGAIPGDGDTIRIRDGVTVTVADARIVGPSGASGTPAIHLQKSGALVIAKGGDLRVRGDVIYTPGLDATTTAVTVQGGGAWHWDASKAAAPQATCYSFHSSGDMAFRAFVLAGSAESHAVLGSDPAGGAGAFSRADKYYGGPFKAEYGDIARIGGTNTAGWDIKWSPRPVGVIWDVKHTTFSGCGQIRITGFMQPGGVFRHAGNVHEGTLSKFVFLAFPCGPAANGVRELTGNVFDVAAAEKTMIDGYTITGNYFGGGLNVLWQSGSWALCEGNFYRLSEKWCHVTGNRLVDAFVFLDRDWDNPHVLHGTPRYPIDLDGLIFSHAGACNYDSGEWMFTQPGCRRTIFLSNLYGYASGEITAILGAAAGKEWTFEHNTWFGGFKESMGYAAIQYSEAGNTRPGAIKSFRSNILWNPQLPGKKAKFLKMNDIHSMGGDQRGAPPVLDVGNPGDIDYNTGWNYVPNAELDFRNKGHYNNFGKGYIGNWSKTPGEHDVDEDPRFVDYQRDLPLFATKCLGVQPSRGEWSAAPATPYAVGDTVVHATGILWGLPVLYRYIGGGGANPEPGAGTRKEGDAGQWRKSWEWASLHCLREGVRTGQRFGDGDVIMHLIKWVRAGYAPTNPALKGAAHDGTDIGAVPFAPRVPSGE